MSSALSLSSSAGDLALPENEKKFLPFRDKLPELRNGVDIYQFYLSHEKLNLDGRNLYYSRPENRLLGLTVPETELLKILLDWPKKPTSRIRIKEKGQAVPESFFTIKADSDYGSVDFSGELPVFLPKIANPEQTKPQEPLRQNLEFERPISTELAYKLLYRIGGLTHRVIGKTRYELQSLFSHPFEVDVFKGPHSFNPPDFKIADNSGLILVELELSPADNFDLARLPDWIDQDVSNDKRFGNSSLSEHPFATWEQKDSARRNAGKILIPNFPARPRRRLP